MTTYDSQGNPVPVPQVPQDQPEQPAPEVDQYRDDANSAGANFAAAPTPTDRDPNAEQAPTAQHRAPETTPEPEPAKDSQPALATTAPEFNGNDAEGVDMSTLPAFKQVQRMLPAQRMREEMNTAKMVTGLPDSLSELATGGEVELDFTALDPADLDALVDMFDAVQAAVLDAAEDRTAMEDWLMDQEDPTSAIMAAFTKYRTDLGN